MKIFVSWYNEHRPSRAQGLNGGTPSERSHGETPARLAPRLEPRARYPAKPSELRAPRGKTLELFVTGFEGRPHLPVVTLKVAA
ncbi:MAG TPA: hypothetical protein VGJ84_08425 [Polyangiaceae bacterium]